MLTFHVLKLSACLNVIIYSHRVVIITLTGFITRFYIKRFKPPISQCCCAHVDQDFVLHNGNYTHLIPTIHSQWLFVLFQTVEEPNLRILLSSTSNVPAIPEFESTTTYTDSPVPQLTVMLYTPHEVSNCGYINCMYCLKYLVMHAHLYSGQC